MHGSASFTAMTSIPTADSLPSQLTAPRRRRPLAVLLAALLAVPGWGLAAPAATAARHARQGPPSCGAPELTSGPERALLTRIVQRLNVDKLSRKHIVHVALVRSDVINSWELPVDSTHYLVCIPRVMAQFVSGAEGELAFVVAHEVGHALDDKCRTAEGRLAVAKEQGSIGATLGELFGGAQSAFQWSGLAQEKGCEERADGIGFVLFRRAGYNPFDAAGAFGRLEMYSGDTGGVLNQVKSLGSGHPMTADRIKHMRELLIEEMQERKRQ